MYFDPSYFKEEERDGFVVKSIMKRVWSAQLEILAVIDDICKRHNIKYYAQYGTLLGAVRHGGFIPWDDDLDIGMLRKDYMRFLHYVKDELPEGFHFISAYTNSHTQLIARVVNGRNITTESSFLERFHGCPYIVGVDIFVSDNIPLSEDEKNMQLELFSIAYALQQNWFKDTLTEDEKSEYLHELENLCNIKFDQDAPMFQQILRLCDQLCAMYWDIEATEVSVFPHLLENPEFRFPVSCFESCVEVPFETVTIPVPIGYDRILHVEYGHYMTPKISYNAHEYPFFKEQRKLLLERAAEQNIILPDYLMEEV